MHPVSDWTEDYAEARRWADALRRTIRYAFGARITITRHDGPYGRTYYRVEADR